MLKWRFSILSDTDFEIDKGDREGMLDRLAAKLQKTRPGTGINLCGASEILTNRKSHKETLYKE